MGKLEVLSQPNRHWRLLIVIAWSVSQHRNRSRLVSGHCCAARCDAAPDILDKRIWRYMIELDVLLEGSWNRGALAVRYFFSPLIAGSGTTHIDQYSELLQDNEGTLRKLELYSSWSYYPWCGHRCGYMMDGSVGDKTIRSFQLSLSYGSAAGGTRSAQKTLP